MLAKERGAKVSKTIAKSIYELANKLDQAGLFSGSRPYGCGSGSDNSCRTADW
jgi:hypothetical protein